MTDSYVVMRGDRPWTAAVWDRVRTFPGEWTDCVETYPHPDLTPRYIFVLHWSKRVPDDFVHRYPVINFHCTPLPYGRGGHPIQNMKLRGWTHTVMTAHQMTPELDGGPIYLSWVGIPLQGDYETVLGRFVHPVSQLIEVLVHCEIRPTPQDGEIVRFHRLNATDLARANTL